MNVIGLLRHSLWLPVKQHMKLYILRERFKTKFQDAHVVPDNVFPIGLVSSVGRESYGFFKIIEFGNITECRLHIGAYCSIGQEVTFILGGEHQTDLLSTYPFDKRIFGENDSKRIQKGDIQIADDVWIGYGATILSGVHIGQGAVIGARSVVAKDIPPYAIFAGGRIMRYRFEKNVIEKMLRIDLKRLDREKAIEYREILEKTVTEEWFANNQLLDNIQKGVQS